MKFKVGDELINFGEYENHGIWRIIEIRNEYCDMILIKNFTHIVWSEGEIYKDFPIRVFNRKEWKFSVPYLNEQKLKTALGLTDENT